MQIIVQRAGALALLMWASAVLLPGTALSSPAESRGIGPSIEVEANALYDEIGLRDAIARDAFVAGYRSAREHDLPMDVIAIADMSQPSTTKRLAVIDLRERKLVLHTWVAHGQGSGDLNAEQFGNGHGSHMTSLGLFRVGAKIASPKHGPALLLHGLEHGVNDQARARELIIHGADYVSKEFIAKHGRLGRSWGCPAVPRDAMSTIISLLASRGVLFIYA